jgi:hypothetical protein
VVPWSLVSIDFVWRSGRIDPRQVAKHWLQQLSLLGGVESELTETRVCDVNFQVSGISLSLHVAGVFVCILA